MNYKVGRLEGCRIERAGKSCLPVDGDKHDPRRLTAGSDRQIPEFPNHLRALLLMPARDLALRDQPVLALMARGASPALI
jgi:hypothetical protein